MRESEGKGKVVILKSKERGRRVIFKKEREGQSGNF